ncbi:MAG: hypothetical protein ACR2Q3_17885 [Woeseiaceae bacterium]
MRLPLVGLVVAMGASAGLQADELRPIVDAAEYTNIGRVFMSPAERRELDRLRKAIPTELTGPIGPNASSAETASPAEPNTRAAGYIVPSNGLPYRWTDGDFRRTTRGDIGTGQLPGAISIIRHQGEDVPATTTGQDVEKEANSENVSNSKTSNDGAN